MEIFLLKGQCCSGNSSGLRCTISFKLPFFMLQLIPAINLLMNLLSKCMCNILYDIKLTVTEIYHGKKLMNLYSTEALLLKLGVLSHVRIIKSIHHLS